MIVYNSLFAMLFILNLMNFGISSAFGIRQSVPGEKVNNETKDGKNESSMFNLGNLAKKVFSDVFAGRKLQPTTSVEQEGKVQIKKGNETTLTKPEESHKTDKVETNKYMFTGRKLQPTISIEQEGKVQIKRGNETTLTKPEDSYKADKVEIEEINKSREENKTITVSKKNLNFSDSLGNVDKIPSKEVVKNSETENCNLSNCVCLIDKKESKTPCYKLCASVCGDNSSQQSNIHRTFDFDSSKDDLDNSAVRPKRIGTGGDTLRYILKVAILMLGIPVICLVGFVICRKALHLFQRRHYTRTNFLIDGMYSETNPLCFSDVVQMN